MLKMDETSPGSDIAKPSVDGLLDKFHKMQAYLPVLEIMINMLKNRNDKPRQAQLEKIRYVKKLIAEKKLTTVDSLRKCESLLRNYWRKFQDQLDKIPDIVFESSDGTELLFKGDSLKSCGSSEESTVRIEQSSAHAKAEDRVVVPPSNRPRSPENGRESVSSHGAVSESRRKNKNPVQKLNHVTSVDHSKSSAEQMGRHSSLSPVYENTSSKKEVWSHTRKDGGSSKHVDASWKDLDRHKSKEPYSDNFDHHKSRQKHYNSANIGGHSKYADPRTTSPKYRSPERKSFDGKRSDISETLRFSDEHLEASSSGIRDSKYSSNKNNVRKELCERDPVSSLQGAEFSKKLDDFLSSEKKRSETSTVQKFPPIENVDKSTCPSETNINSKNICSDDSSRSTNILGKLSEEELKRLVTENLSNLPPLPPETKCILETIKQCTAKQGTDAVSSKEISPVKSDFENMHPVGMENCQKIYQPSSRDPRRHSKDGQVDNLGNSGLRHTPTIESMNQSCVQSLPSNNDNLTSYNFIPVVSQMDSFSSRQSFVPPHSQIDVTNIQSYLPVTSSVEQMNVPLLPHGQQIDSVSGAGFLLPKSPVENTSNRPTLLPLPVPHFNNMGNKSSPRDPRRCIQDPKINVTDGPHQIPNMCVQPSVYQGADIRLQSAPVLNMQPMLPETMPNRIDYCHGMQASVPYQNDLQHPVRQFSGGNIGTRMPVSNQHQVFHPTYTSLSTAPRSMELSGYVRPNLHTVIPVNNPVFNNRPSIVPKVQTPAPNRSTTNNQESTQNARKKVMNSWLAIDPKNSSKLPSLLTGRSKYSQNSCKFQRPLNNSLYSSHKKGGDALFSEKRKEEQKRHSSDINASKSSYDSKNSRDGEKDLTKKKNEIDPQSKSNSLPNSPAPNKSLYGAIIVSKDVKGKDVPQKFKIPKLKKTENSDTAVDNDGKNTTGKGEEDEFHKVQELLEKSLESLESKKKLMEALSSLGMEVKDKDCDLKKETVKSKGKVNGKDEVTGSNSEIKELCAKTSKTKSTEKRIKKYILSSSDEDANEVSILHGVSQEKSASSEKNSSKKSDHKKRPVVVNSNISSNERNGKAITKASKLVEKKKIKPKNSKNKANDVETAETVISDTETEVSQDSSMENCKEDSRSRNLENASSMLPGETVDGKIVRKAKCENENIAANDKLNDGTHKIATGAASKKTKKFGSVRHRSLDSATEETSLDSVSVMDVQKSNKENDNLKKRSLDILEISDGSDGSSANKRKKSKMETAIHNELSEVASNTDIKGTAERKRTKKLSNASDNTGNADVTTLKKAKMVAAIEKHVQSEDNSDSLAEESFDSSYSYRNHRKGHVKVCRNSLDSSEDEMVPGKLASKKIKKKRLVRKKLKAVIDDSSEDEILERRLPKNNKCREKNNSQDGSITGEATEKSASNLKKLQKVVDSDVSDEQPFVGNTKFSRASKANRSVSLGKNYSGTDDESSDNGLSDSNRVCDSQSKSQKKLSVSKSDIYNGDSVRGRGNLKKTKAQKNVSESDDSTKDPKQNKKGLKRRNALEMLQDDIREMFIGNEVALAFGQRKCTVRSQSERRNEEVTDMEEKKRVGKKRHTNKQTLSIKISSEESDTDDEMSEKIFKDEKKMTKGKISRAKEFRHLKDVYTCKNLKVQARRPYKEISQGLVFTRESFADAFYFCKNKPSKYKNSRLKLQDVLGKLWSRVFKLGMNIQMGSDSGKRTDLEGNVNHLEQNESNCETESENKNDVTESAVIYGTESTVVCGSNLDSQIGKVGEAPFENKEDSNVETFSGVQSESNASEGPDKGTQLYPQSKTENNSPQVPQEEKKEFIANESEHDNLLKQVDQPAEPEKLNAFTEEEAAEADSVATSNLADECDETVSNISICDSDISEKSSVISLSESVVSKKNVPKKTALGKVAKGKRKKKTSNWQNGVIKKKVKLNKLHPNELVSAFQDHIVTSPGLGKEKLHEDKIVCEDNLADPSYAIDGRGKYECKYCNFAGVKIVPHYKQSHPDKEVCISRLSSTVAEKAKSEAQNDVRQDLGEEKDNSSVRRQKRSFICRICHQFAEYIFDFYCHVTTHTGEYDFKCDSCSYTSSNASCVKHHILLHHNGFSRTISLKRGPPHTAKVLYGYLCSICNFIQVLKENMESHIALRHQKDMNAEIIRIDMSIPLEERSTNETDCSSESVENACEPNSFSETNIAPLEDAVGNSATVSDKEVEETISESQHKKISSKNVPASMNPVVVLKGMKNLMEKGATSPKADITEPLSQDLDIRNERHLSNEVCVREEDITAEKPSVTEKSQNDVSQNEGTSVQKPVEKEAIVDEVAAESSRSSVTELNADSTSSLNENTNLHRYSTTEANNCFAEATESACSLASEVASMHSDSTHNEVSQEEIDDDNDDARSHILHESNTQAAEVVNVSGISNREDADEEENMEVVGDLDVGLISSEETGGTSPRRSDASAYKRTTSLLERIQFLCAQSNAADKQIDSTASAAKHSRVDAGKSKKNMTEPAERSTITTRARKQVSSMENIDVNRVAIENEGALIGYSSGAATVSSLSLESVVTDEESAIPRENLRETSDDTLPESSGSAEDASTTSIDHNYIKVVSASSGTGIVGIKQEILDPEHHGTDNSDANKLELYDVTSMPDPTVSSICIGPMEARREGERILFCCRISGCNFQCPQAVKFACHYNNEHEKEWDGFCFLCGEIIDGIKPFCLEQAVEHLLSFHLTSKLKQKSRTNRSSLKTKSPSVTQKKVCGKSVLDGITSTVVTMPCTTTVTSITSTTAINVATLSEVSNVNKNTEKGNSYVETQVVADLLKNAVVIKNEPCEDESTARNDKNEGEVNPPVVCSTADVPEERPRIRVRRISGDRLSCRTEEPREPPSVIVNPSEVPTKVESNDTEEADEHFPALDKDVSSDVSQSTTAVLWPELSSAVCDERILENSTGHCSPVLWHGDTGGDTSDTFSSIRIESVVSLNPEANIQENIVMEDVEPGPISPPASSPSKRTYTRLQVDATSIKIGSPPSASSVLHSKPIISTKPKPLVKKTLAPLKPKGLPLSQQASAGLQKQEPKSASRVAVIKPLSNEVSLKDIVTGKLEKRAGMVAPPKIASAPRAMKNLKSPEAFRTMLEPVKLQRLFKCLYYTCVFTTSSEERFLAHGKAHERTMGPGCKTKQQDWNRCVYCLKVYTSIKALVDHIVAEHGFCLYQCAYCFFRAMSPTYVLLHQKASHVREAVAIIIDQRRRKMPELKDFPDKRENRRTVVLPYECAQGACGARFYQCDSFLEHLKKEHSQLTIYSCHLCECKSIKPEALLSHYKWHCLYQYQCMYCLHGADSAVDMKHHLCNFHSDQPNKAIIRIFQDNNERQSNKQVENLLTIDLDEGMDYSNLYVQCQDDESEADNVDTLTANVQPGYLSPVSSESSFLVDSNDIPATAPPPVQAPQKPGPKPKGTVPTIIGLEGNDLFHCGNKGCIHTSATSSELKDHLSMCDFARESSMMECVHCKKKFKTISSLVEHLLSHGAERFCCSNCGFKSTMCTVVEKHCRQVHKFPATKTDPVYTGEVNSDTMWYVIRPREKRRMVKTAKSQEKKSYDPRDVHKLPDKDIFKDPVACSMCSFNTRVRVNMVRHLEMHEAGKSSAGTAVPSSCPVNPVPCLGRNELMFDKMENLAASSQAVRLGNDTQPSFVPERFRYVCGVADCRYMGCDEEMLRKHVCTLHAGEATYVCAHCKQSVAIDAQVSGVLEHLRMHGGKLYRCTYCAFFHYQVAQVEKHVASNHPNQQIVPITIRRVVD